MIEIAGFVVSNLGYLIQQRLKFSWRNLHMIDSALPNQSYTATKLDPAQI